jgi:hypothetical protein
VSQIFWLPKPNWQNVGDEMWAQGYGSAEQENGKPAGLRIGVRDTVGKDAKGKPIFRWIIHPKWGDVMKTLWKKGVGGQTGTPSCFTATLDAKPIVKEVKGGLPPSKFNDGLYGELIALKFNLNASDHYSKYEHSGLGGLIYKKPGSPFDGYTIAKFADTADVYMSYCGTYNGKGYFGVATAMDFYTAAHDFNTAFSGPLDTVEFHTVPPPKGIGIGTVVKGVKAVGMVSYLYRTSLELPPVAPVAPYREGQAPVSYKLEQNYPNPFNPTTTFEFRVSSLGIVNLKVFDVLGREVATLVNDVRQPGTYTIRWDASSLPSGVYFYRLRAGDAWTGSTSSARGFIETKKMVFAK